LNFDNFENSHNSFLWPEYFIDYLCERLIPCQASTSVLCLHYRSETVHCSTKDAYTSEITFLALNPCLKPWIFDYQRVLQKFKCTYFFLWFYYYFWNIKQLANKYLLYKLLIFEKVYIMQSWICKQNCNILKKSCMYVMEKNCKCAIHFEGLCAKFPFKTL